MGKKNGKKLLQSVSLCNTKLSEMDQERSSAEADLRVIRSLMERATVYRAISAPAALVAGLLSIVASAAIYLNNQGGNNRPIHGRAFAAIWLAVLLIATATNAFFILREARKDRRPFISSGMRLSLRAIAPNLLIPAAVTVWFWTAGYKGAAELELVGAWIVFYGLALLSTGLFAPRSLVYLGWAFLLTALALPALRNVLGDLPANLPTVIMGLTFGLYHLIYAVCAWPRKSANEIEQFALE
jgi:hypothetical protein